MKVKNSLKKTVITLFFLPLSFLISCSHTPYKMSYENKESEISSQIVREKKSVEKDFHFLLGNMHSYKNENYKASQHFEKALKHSKSSKTSEQNIIKINLAKEHLNNNLMNKALTLLKEVVKSEPENKEALLLLGYLYSEMELHKESLKQYEKVLQKQPFDNEIIKSYILALFKAESYRTILKKLSYYTKASQLKKHHHEYYHMKALVYQYKDKKKIQSLLKKTFFPLFV